MYIYEPSNAIQYNEPSIGDASLPLGGLRF